MEKQQKVWGKVVGEPRYNKEGELRTQQSEVGTVPGSCLLSLCWEQSHTHTHTHTSHCPGQPFLQGGGGGVPEVRSPQLSKASVAQLPRISTRSWAALSRDHTSSASQLLSCTLPTPAPCPSSAPPHTHSLPCAHSGLGQREAGTLPLPAACRQGRGSRVGGAREVRGTSNEQPHPQKPRGTP